MRLCLPFAVAVFALAGARAADDDPTIKLIQPKLQDPKKPFALTVAFKVKAGQEKAFEEAFALNLAGTRKEPGCVVYVLNRDADEPGVYVVYEQFKSLAALAEHINAKHAEKFRATIAPLVEGTPKLKVYLTPVE